MNIKEEKILILQHKQKSVSGVQKKTPLIKYHKCLQKKSSLLTSNAAATFGLKGVYRLHSSTLRLKESESGQHLGHCFCFSIHKMNENTNSVFKLFPRHVLETGLHEMDSPSPEAKGNFMLHHDLGEPQK
ncbi:hypothetical protein ATANTOWER_000203 [Ataeniobius toweri]|uniref:Uncharacterized protein n=1 Tax=Ataeniobius toweri TaxID=208326 RepID=A0ABU7A5B9_9TELE|nr:hypothetical protein [Ataeniobius toweri]